MVYHQSPLRLHCHHCDARRAIPKQCQACHSESLQPVGLGTERVEILLQKYFPNIPIIRIDRDSTRRKGAMQDLLEQVATQSKAILIGTQMLAKGHHFPKVTLVGILDADNGLFSADFRAAEQMGQLLMQVSGRAGRGEQNGSVMIQTHYPEHPLLQTLITQGYPVFANNLLNEREISTLPPYAFLAVFRAEAYQELSAQNVLNFIKNTLPATSQEFSIFGPVPAVMSKKKGLHRQQLILKSNKRSVMQSVLKQSLKKLQIDKNHRKVKWILDVDPIEV
jgi:primosomal protein N' (replication factor Y)